MDCSLPGFSVLGILQARILERVAMPSSKGSSWLRNWTRVSYISCIGRQVLYHYHHVGSPSLSTGTHPILRPPLKGDALNLWPSRLSQQHKNLTSLSQLQHHNPASHGCMSLHDCCCCQVTSVVSNSVQPHRLQPTRLLHPWDSPGKYTGVGCHFLLHPAWLP